MGHTIVKKEDRKLLLHYIILFNPTIGGHNRPQSTTIVTVTSGRVST